MSNNPSKSQKESLVKQFTAVTMATNSDATRLLKKHAWRLDPAVDAFYSDPQAMANAQGNLARGDASSEKRMKENLERMWEGYADPANPTQTSLDGVLKYCQDLGIEPDEDPVTIVIAHLCGSPSMGVFEKNKWIDAWKGVKKDSIEAQKGHIPSLRRTFDDDESFRKVYSFTFDWAKTEGSRSLQCEIAIGLWQLLLPLIPPPKRPGFQEEPHLRLWQEYLVERGSKAISRDTWNLFLEFVRSTDASFATHDLDAAWPALIDDFVDWAKPKVAHLGGSASGGTEGSDAMDLS